MQAAIESPCMTQAGAIERAWKEEVERAVDGSGLPWRVSAAWIEQKRPMYCASLTDTRSGKECRVSLSPDDFATVSARRIESVRQVNAACARR